MRSSLILASFLVASSAFAVPVQWNFQNAVFDDGGTLTGGFVFDVDSAAVVTQLTHPVEIYLQPFYFDVDVVAGDPTTPQTFDNVFFYQTGGLSYSADFVGAELGYVEDPFTFEINPPPAPTADPAAFQNGVTLYRESHCGPVFGDICYISLELDFDQPLTNAGGVVSFTASEVAGASIGGAGYVENTRSIVSGTLVGSTVVPIPAAVWLFGSALAGLGWLRGQSRGA